MLPLVTGHLRRGRSPQQRQFNAVCSTRRQVCSRSKPHIHGCYRTGRVTVVADLKPLLVIAAAAMRRTFHIAELNLMDRIFSPHVSPGIPPSADGEAPPLNRGVELATGLPVRRVMTCVTAERPMPRSAN